MAQHTTYRSRTYDDGVASPAGWAGALQSAALLFGLAFLAVGVAGFIPGLTENLDDIELAGHESGAELLGVFQVSVLHNVVHILFGLAGMAAARRWTWARTYLIAGGISYLGLLAYGLLVDHDADANFVPLDDADNWLHLGLGVAMLGVGLLVRPHADHDVDARQTGALRR
jgi:hypothetical protein